jgi:DNA-binding NarL/FixJ family response regulator
VAVANGNAGIESQRRSPADVVVTDLFMPEKEGLETIAELRTGFPRTKIIAISGGSRLRASCALARKAFGSSRDRCPDPPSSFAS